MAQLIPEVLRSATRGESLLFHSLRDLPEEYVVYHEPYVRNRRPDFVIIGPEIGFVVLEVKDYKKSTLLAANKDEWVLNINGNVVKHTSPLTQALLYIAITRAVDRLYLTYSGVSTFTKYFDQLKEVDRDKGLNANLKNQSTCE